MGRPRQLAIRTQIQACLAAGIPKAVIARKLGVNRKTVQNVAKEVNTAIALQKAEEMEREYRGEIISNVPLKEAARVLARNLRQAKHVPGSNDALRVYQQNLGICQKREPEPEYRPLFVFSTPVQVNVGNELPREPFSDPEHPPVTLPPKGSE